jgi:hypothetical protein
VRDGVVEPVGEAWAGEAGPEVEVVGEEARRAVHLDDREDPAGREAVADAVEEARRVGDLVPQERRPHDVGGRQRRPARVEVGAHGADPVREAVDDRPLGDAAEHRGAGVDRDHLGPAEAPCQRDRPGARAGAEIDDHAARGVAREAADPRRHLEEVAVQDPRIEVEERGESRVRVAVRVRGRGRVGGGGVVVGHGSMLARRCRKRIRSCP